MIYFATDFADTYMFVCLIRASDGVATYCLEHDGDGEEYPFHLKVVGELLMISGSSKSTEFIINPLNVWGNYVLFLNKDLQTTVCQSLYVAEDTTLVWVDDPLPMKTISIVDVYIGTTGNFNSPVTNIINSFPTTLHSLCTVQVQPTEESYSLLPL